MEKENTKNIEEEIRQFKLHKIQIVESKIREYENTFIAIKENVVIKFSKNISSNILRVIFTLITITLLLFGIGLLFPEQLIKLLEENGDMFNDSEKRELIIGLPFLGYFIISISILFGFVSSLLKKNINKRNTIYKLSKLLNEVINYMDENLKEDKKKYEYYVDSIAEIEDKKKESNNKTTQQ